MNKKITPLIEDEYVSNKFLKAFVKIIHILEDVD